MIRPLTLVLIAISLFAFWAALTTPAAAIATETWEVIANAAPDECFYEVGSDLNQYPMTGPCDPPGQLKTNEAYVWGLTKYGDNIFFGTGPNIHCLVMQGYLGQTDPVITADYVCEASANPPYGDMRPPGLYRYNEDDGLVRLNNLIAMANPAAGLLVQTTLGIRSAGSNDGVAFLAGPGSGGINMFAFDAETGAFLGATTIADYSNVRKWLVASDGELYVGLGGGETDAGGGAVWRWTGSKDDLTTLFDFEEVGIGLDGDAAELAEHDGRIFVSTWPGGGSAAGIWMSLPLAQLTAANKENWLKVWDAIYYEPDPVTARTYGGGAVASFAGWFYWGTMHVPGTAAQAHASVYGDAPDKAAQAQRLIGTWRAITIFRGRNFGLPTQEIELLYGGSSIYGATNLQAYLVDPSWPGSPFDPAAPRSWQTVSNGMGLTPKYGLAGFGNIFNNYTWIMEVWNNALYVGTMDHSYLILSGIGDEDIPPELQPFFDCVQFGADLYRFNDSSSSAVAVNLDGMGNPMNYGIRTAVSSNPLYLGTANPMNLNPDGGWQLIKLTDPTTNLISGESRDGYVSQGDWMYYKIDASSSDEHLFFELTGLDGDVDLYVKEGFWPTLDDYDCRPYLAGTNPETCSLQNSEATAWYIGVHGYMAGGYTIKALSTADVPGAQCSPRKVFDCAGNCVDRANAQLWTGDGYCDDGTWGMDLRCDAFDNDGLDCGGTGDPGAQCLPGRVFDCVGSCVDQATAQLWTGDGYCDNGTLGMVLTCPEFANDGGDCGG
jgi:hypothetical protein